VTIQEPCTILLHRSWFSHQNSCKRTNCDALLSCIFPIQLHFICPQNSVSTFDICSSQ